MHHGILLLISCIFFSCSSPLNIREVKSLDQGKFEDIRLVPMPDFYELRHDIIRQQVETTIQEGITDTDDVPYHRLGFYLGNGLFFDLNDNLSFDLLALLSIDKSKNFEVEKRLTKRPKVVYKSISTNGLYCRMKVTAKEIKSKNCREIRNFKNKTILSKNQKIKSAITQNKDTLVLYNKKYKPKDILIRDDAHTYRRQLDKRAKKYQVTGRGVDLGRYFIKMKNNNREIQILRKRKKRNYHLLTMIRSDNNIIIFNKKSKGQKLAFEDEGLSVYSNDTRLFEMRPTSVATRK